MTKDIPCFHTIAALAFWEATAEDKHLDSEYVRKKAYAAYETAVKRNNELKKQLNQLPEAVE